MFRVPSSLVCPADDPSGISVAFETNWSVAQQEQQAVLVVLSVRYRNTLLVLIIQTYQHATVGSCWMNLWKEAIIMCSDQYSASNKLSIIQR